MKDGKEYIIYYESVPLTASWIKGRNTHYPYYRCPNTKGCGARPKSDQRERVETLFEDLLASVTPRLGLIKLTKEITKGIYLEKQSELGKLSSVNHNEAEKLETQIDSLIDRICKIDSGTVIERLEKRIDTLEQEKRIHTLKAKQASQILPNIELVTERVFDFIENPHVYWTHGDLNQKRLVQNIVFSEPLTYSKQSGFGTAKLSLPFNMLNMKDKDKRNLAEVASTEKQP